MMNNTSNDKMPQNMVDTLQNEIDQLKTENRLLKKHLMYYLSEKNEQLLIDVKQIMATNTDLTMHLEELNKSIKELY
ncbi:hypothetical protein TetV_137 [Tetraselmis virus 1]|uniref:Uncharacterized protein n=1 Tax=Tetraselmis virus 1 TaxID=2060617 RepID=A0A2P0VN97_9VIRU|nr:hypothetical protein QJ968_gp137 [Tetraselmis virus 1]AUF82229.1 hypothetical protein TetV_137 [Tetraselmis virus 1]